MTQTRTLPSSKTRLVATPFDRLLGRARLMVDETERAVALAKGRALGVYGPGEHVLRGRLEDLSFVAESVGAGRASSSYAAALLREGRGGPELAEFRTESGEVALVLRDGAPFEVIAPDGRALYWTAAGPWSAERWRVTDGEEIAPATAKRLTAAANAQYVMLTATAPLGHALLVFVNGVYLRSYAEGTRSFWSLRQAVQAKVVDMRAGLLEVGGQDILTADRVSIRLSVTAAARVTDALASLSAAEDWRKALHTGLQLVLRDTVSARKLDALLAERVKLDEGGLSRLRADMAALGVEIGTVEVKDVILPADMRAIMNSVVAAEKEAEANVIKRREETNATRSLLNTARLLAENPAMMRLKELEALESIAGKVEKLIIHNGPKGLLEDVARLGD